MSDVPGPWGGVEVSRAARRSLRRRRTMALSGLRGAQGTAAFLELQNKVKIVERSISKLLYLASAL